VSEHLLRLRTDPVGCAHWLTTNAGLWDVDVTVAAHDAQMTVLAVRFGPPPPQQLPGYPEEEVRISVGADGRIIAVPLDGDQRSWEHRYPRISLRDLCSAAPHRPVPWEVLFGALCLQYPRDPQRLRWRWDDGLDDYVQLVQRHVWAEEYSRRHGHWPVEDVPHGERPDGVPHPVRFPDSWSGA